MNKEIEALMTSAGYGSYDSPESYWKARDHDLILLCASKVANDSFYYDRIMELLEDDPLSY